MKAPYEMIRTTIVLGGLAALAWLVAAWFGVRPEVVIGFTGITLGVYATGFLVLTALYKIAVSVKEELSA